MSNYARANRKLRLKRRKKDEKRFIKRYEAHQLAMHRMLQVLPNIKNLIDVLSHTDNFEVRSFLATIGFHTQEDYNDLWNQLH